MMKSIRLLTTLLLLFCSMSALNAKVSQSTADSIGLCLNASSPVCDTSCSYYAAENKTIGLGNTIFTLLLILFGTIWLFKTYKKAFFIPIGLVLGLAVLGTYFYPTLIVKRTVPSNCPVIKQTGQTTTAFLTLTTNELEQVAPSGAAPSNLEEFQSTTDEFQTTSVTTEIQAKPKLLDFLQKPQVYEPMAIFLIIAFISLMIKYPWFRKTRGLFLLASIIYLGFYRGACPCMISSFEDIPLMILGVPVKPEALLWFLLLLPATYLFGKIWCGWLCHLGGLQEFLHQTPKLKILQSRKTQKTLKIIQLSVLAVWMLQLVFTRSNLFCQYDPFKVAYNLISPNALGYVLLGLLLVSSVLIYRPFCRTICPVGVILGWISLIPGARILDKNVGCIHCKSCDPACRSRAMIHENKTTTLRNEDCILCGECMSACKSNVLFVRNKKTNKD
jgi:NAD-dependent dihydropyrimidine dehydrogenase PreA subunit